MSAYEYVVSTLFRGKPSKKYLIIILILANSIPALFNNASDIITSIKENPNKQSRNPLGANVEPPVIYQEEEMGKHTNASSCIKQYPFKDNLVEYSYENIKEKNGYYIPTGRGKSWEGIIWLVDVTNPSFKKIDIEYEIIQDQNQGKPPAFIFAIAKQTENKKREQIMKTWLPEFTSSDLPQLIGFSKLNDDGNLDRIESISLSDPIKLNQVDSLVVESTAVTGNEMSISFSYHYTSNRNNSSMSHPHTQQVKFPLSNLEKSSEKLDVGIGTYIGNGLRIISLNICY